MSNKQTAVQWLIEQLPIIQQEGLRDVIEDAIHMEKQQIIDAWNNGDTSVYRESAKQSYNEQFKKD